MKNNLRMVSGILFVFTTGVFATLWIGFGMSSISNSFYSGGMLVGFMITLVASALALIGRNCKD